MLMASINRINLFYPMVSNEEVRILTRLHKRARGKKAEEVRVKKS
jgi:hypothetical protein